MHSHPPELTSERIKSHLQKFRKHRQKEKGKFLEDYDKFLEVTRDFQDDSDFGMISLEKVLGGKAAALVSYSVMKECETPKEESSPLNILENTFTHTTNKSGFPAARIPFPALSEKEKSSPLGMSLMLVMGLLEHMDNYLVEERSQNHDHVTRQDPGPATTTAGAGAGPLGYPSESCRSHESSTGEISQDLFADFSRTAPCPMLSHPKNSAGLRPLPLQQLYDPHPSPAAYSTTAGDIPTSQNTATAPTSLSSAAPPQANPPLFSHSHPIMNKLMGGGGGEVGNCSSSALLGMLMSSSNVDASFGAAPGADVQLAPDFAGIDGFGQFFPVASSNLD
jgi:hypothetical protein